MTRTSPLHVLLLAATLGLSALGCQGGGVGDPCIPEDEFRQDFNGYAVTEVNVESKSFQCETRVCIVNHFQGRVSCPYGQDGEAEGDIIHKGEPDYKVPADKARCRVPGTDGTHCVDTSATGAAAVLKCDEGNGANILNIDEITVPVDAQRIYRNAQDTVYCSCRCKGPDPSARYCECPSGYECSELVRELGLPGKAQLAGSYCVKAGTVFNPQHPPGPETCMSERIAKHEKTTDNRYDITEVCGPAFQNP